MAECCVDDRLYYQSDLLKSLDGIGHCFTTKCGGASCGRIRGLNLGFRVGDHNESVKQNYRIISQDMGFNFERITAGRQTHSSNIRIIKEEDAGKGVSRESEFLDVDGIVTNVEKLPLVVYYADCVPVLLAAEEERVVAAVHSGWRGTVSEIVAEAVDIMKTVFGVKSDRIKAAIGPSIGPCCFETDGEVARQFDTEFVTGTSEGKFMVDLWSANKRILKKSGLKEKNIDVLKICTVCRNDVLYSYRKNKEATGRMGAFIELR